MRKKGTHRTTKTVTGWAKAAPDRVPEMMRVYRACGRTAFLDFNAYDPAASRYPIVPKYARKGSCAPDCRGLRAAYARARQQGDQAIARKAIARAGKAGCAWAKRSTGKRRR